MRTVLYPFVIPDAILDELNATLGDVSQLTPDELTALSFCLIEESISNQRLQYVLNLHRSDITHLLKKLCMEGYLESDYNGRWTTYKIKANIDTSTRKVATPSESSKKGNLERKKDATSSQKGATSTQKGATFDSVIDISESGEKSYQGKNLKREDLEKIIVKLCKDRYMKKEELASELGKSESYIRNKILPDLLKDGKLIKRFPFTHNHPEQGYKTSEEYSE